MFQLIPSGAYKPYVVRALYEWCADAGFTPYLTVLVNNQTRVPMAYVRDGQITLNISMTATQNLQIDNEAITFNARFGGAPFSLYIPMGAVIGIYARESAEGLFFEPEEPDISSEPEETSVTPQSSEPEPAQPTSPPPTRGKPKLTVVK